MFKCFFSTDFSKKFFVCFSYFRYYKNDKTLSTEVVLYVNETFAIAIVMTAHTTLTGTLMSLLKHKQACFEVLIKTICQL